MPEQISPIHETHPYCTTCHPTDFTEEVWLREKGRQSKDQAEHTDKSKAIVKFGLFNYFFFHGWVSCCKKVLGNSSDCSNPKGTYSFSLGI